MQVLELDPDYKAVDEDFTLEIAAGTAVVPAKEGTEYGKAFFRTKKVERVNANDLPAMFDMLKAAPTTPLMDTAIPHRGWWSSWRARTLMALAGLVVVGLAAVAVRRRRRRF